MTRDALLDVDEDLTPYERERAAQLARNRARLAELEIPASAARLAPLPKPKNVAAAKKGVAARKKREAPDPSTRRSSSRLKGLQSDGAYIVEERARGGVGSRITVCAPNADAAAAGMKIEVIQKEDDGPGERHPSGDLPFKSENGVAGMDEAFLENLRTAAVAAAGPAHDASGWAAAPSPTTSVPPALKNAALADEDVAKVTREGVVHLAFHPTATRGDGGGGHARLLLAAGAKSGRVSLWDVDWARSDGGAPGPGPGAGSPHDEATAEDGATADAGAAAGVLEFAPHYSYISGLAWAGRAGPASTLFTASYDGSVRALDVAAGAWAPALLHADAEFSAFDVRADAAWGVVADKDGACRIFDPRAGGLPAVERKEGDEGGPPPPPTAGSRGAVVAAYSLSDRKVNCVSIEPGQGFAFAASFSDGAVRVFDARALTTGAGSGGGGTKKSLPTARPIASAAHPQTVQGCYFAPDGSGRLLTTSRDDTLGVWGGLSGGGGKKGAAADLTRLATARHNNNTGRWIIPFRAIWLSPSWAGDTVAVGGMSRTIDVFAAGSGGPLASLRSPDAMTAIPSRLAAHPGVPVLAGATASGRINVFRGPGA